MLIYSMGVSADGFIADREGEFGWSVPDEEQFAFHLAEVRELNAFLCGRRLYETMLVWETDPSMRGTELEAAFADAWCALPKVVFSRTLGSVEGNARLAAAPLAEEAAAAGEAAGGDVGIGGAGLAATAVELGLVDELRMFRHPVVVGGGTPFLPPVTRTLPLELVETRTFASRVVYERYRRVAEDNVEIVRRMYHDVIGRPAALYDMLAEDVEWDTSGLGRLDLTETPGREGVAEYFRVWLAPFAEWGFEAEELFGTGDHVVAHIHQWGRGKSSGAQVDHRFWQVWTFRNGRAVRASHHQDKAAALAAAGVSE